MADILIDVPIDVVERLKKRAAANDRELDDELTSIAMAWVRRDAAEHGNERSD
ncbi:MAG: hypothetical protein AB7F09_10520 [Parvibaculaceae bacterium]